LNRKEEHKKLEEFNKGERIRKIIRFFPKMTQDEKDELFDLVEESSKELGRFIDYLSDKYILKKD